MPTRLDELSERLRSIDSRLAHMLTIIPMMRTDLLEVRDEVDKAREWERRKAASND